MSAQFEMQFFESVLKKHPKYLDVMEILGQLYTENGRLDEGLKIDQKLVRLDPSSPTAQYNLACSYALKNRKKEALEALQKAVALGYDDWAWLIQDPDLESLLDDPDFQTLLNKKPTANTSEKGSH
jgi:tetratricopeptide (TPR) repeat protein